MSTTDTRAIAPAITDVPPSPAGDMATQSRALPLSQLALIGIAGRPDNRRALLRTRNGRILRVALGDRTPHGTVQAIGATELFLTRAGRTTRLALPD